MDPSENPYASPAAVTSKQVEIQSRPRLKMPFVGLVIFLIGFAHSLFGTTFLVTGVYLYKLADQGVEHYSKQYAKADFTMIIVGSLIWTLRGLLLILAGANIRAGCRRYAGLSGILLVIGGILFPAWWLDVPFGIWALILYRRQVSRTIFENGPVPDLASSSAVAIEEPI